MTAVRSVGPNGKAPPSHVKELIFLGTGTSGNVPNIYCLTQEVPDCKVCLGALNVRIPSENTPGGGLPPAPIWGKNKRRNTSAVVRYMHSDGKMRTILIDCGKNFYESALTWFVQYRLRRIDAVIITHGHADAMLGMDDLRQWTIGGANYSVQDHIDVYLSSQSMEVVTGAFPYLVDKGKATGGGDVPSLQFHVFDNNGLKPFKIEELEVVPLEVEHGRIPEGPFMSLGFRFGDLTYISDASAIPQKTKDLIKGTKILVLDALHYVTHASHLSIPESIDMCASMLPPGGRAYLTGFSHRVDHDTLATELSEDNTLRKANVKVEPAYDGLRVHL
ncbi:hypothetical protein PhCBS80983_g00769 [Powellomyces hirtus]|uniref:Metallo-beta-lactamase domain-containing protein n=1 Tax=Powellomyces hirtus TaxID=109895 RepID=A0A507EET6_9FUNG|nr:hypothetical protein PhCBS80983_g00769 [Powellomyces hirtus]